MEIDVKHIVGTSEISRAYGVTKQAVWNWSRRHADFPRPIKMLAAGPIFDEREIRIWLNGRKG